MKNRFISVLFLLLVLPLLFIGCRKLELLDIPNSSATNLGDKSDKSTVVYSPCGNQLVANLYPEGTLSSTGPVYNTSVSYGTVTVGNDLVNLYITYELAAGKILQNTYLYVGTAEGLTSMIFAPPALPNSIDPGGTGYFHVGSFPYKYSPYPASGSYTKVIPLSSLPNCFIIAAFADIPNETGYFRVSAKEQTGLKSFGYYLDYCRQRCGNSSCETAYAFGNNSAKCFLTIPGVTSNNWGWSNGPVGVGSYSWPIYAGAGQCDIGKGTLVGTLDVVYDGAKATITYNMGTSCHLSTTHLYVGNLILPLKNNKKTTAPGQFPYKHENLNGVSTDSYTVTGLSGLIYIAAHSDVCW